MRSIKTRGVVIKRMNYGEADRILTIFTERLGKIKALAKGVRKITSKMAGNLEPYNLLQLELHEGKTFYTVTAAEIVTSYNQDGSLNKKSQTVYASEIIDKFFEDGEKNFRVFTLFCDLLREIEKAEGTLHIRSFELKILAEAGFQPDFEHCAACRTILQAGKNYINTLTGDIICANCNDRVGSSKKVEDGVIKLLRLLQQNRIDICDKIKCETAYTVESEKILDLYLKNALERELISKKYL